MRVALKIILRFNKHENDRSQALKVLFAALQPSNIKTSKSN